MDLKQHGSLVEQVQHVASQDINNSHLSHKQSQDECHQVPAAQVSLQNSQAVEIQNTEKDPVLNNEVVKTYNPCSETQYAKLQQMSNQQATVSEQASNQINCNKQVPFGALLPILMPQLAKDRAMQLQTLFTKLKKDEIPKSSFVQLMKSTVVEQLLRLALAQVQMQSQTMPNQGPAVQQQPVRMATGSSGARQLNDPHVLAQMCQRSMGATTDQSRMTSTAGQTVESSARKSQESDDKIESQGLQSSQLPSSSSVAKGFLQKEGVDYVEGFAPVARIETVRFMVAIACVRNWSLHQLDVKSAFLNGPLEEEVYVEQPPGFRVAGHAGKVFKLRKALYGLKQAPRAGNKKIDSVLVKIGFVKCISEHDVYVKGDTNTNLIISCLYVDDLLISGGNDEDIAKVKQLLMSQFEMTDMGFLSYFLGINSRKLKQEF